MILNLYLQAFLTAVVTSLLLTPLARLVAKKLNVYDYPHSDVKTHKEAVPYFGGVAIVAAFYISMLVVRFTTDFPTGTLRALRGVFAASFFVFILGMIDDIKHKGLHFSQKFIFQFIAAILLISYGIKIEFISPEWFGLIITVIWIVGITNALNIVDVMDGLSSGVAVIAAFAFFFIGLPAEEHLYVNFVSIGLAGAILGFMPYNFSRKHKIFMGDAGSLFIGVILSAVALGTKYTEANELGVFVPIIILAIPIFDTLFVMFVRYKKRLSPFLGSKDHFALRLRAIGYSDKKILIRVYLTGIVLFFLASLVTKIHSNIDVIIIYLLCAIFVVVVARYLYKIKI